MHENDVYLSSSIRDGTSLCLLEAMATGIFPIVSRIKANTAWLDDGESGLLYKVGDADDLAKCIMKLLNQPEIAVEAARRNRKKVVEKGDRNNNMKCLERIYKDLIDKGQLKMRIYAMLGEEEDLPLDIDLVDYFKKHRIEEYGNHLLSVRSIKLFFDGALGSRGAAFFEPYEDDPQNTGLLRITPEYIYKISEAALKSSILGVVIIGLKKGCPS